MFTVRRAFLSRRCFRSVAVVVALMLPYGDVALFGFGRSADDGLQQPAMTNQSAHGSVSRPFLNVMFGQVADVCFLAGANVRW